MSIGFSFHSGRGISLKTCIHNLNSPSARVFPRHAALLFANLKFGNNTFDLSRFARRRKRRQPQNMAHITSDLSVRK
jgi:hypothetical protein